MCENLGLITRGVKGVEEDTTESINSTYKDVCNGLGCFEEPYHIVVEQDTMPVKEPPRRVSFGLQDRLKLKLDLMEKHKVIQKVNKPTDWVHNLVIMEKKDGSLRLCLDPRELNKTIKRENFQIPTVEDVTCRLSGKKVFTVIDLKDAFWQVLLSEESASLTTFNTPFGRHFFKRMPFGLCSASEVRQKRVYQTFGDIDDVHVIADDIIIASNSEEEADRTLIKLFKRAQEKNVKFNIAKLQLKKSEVSFMGYIVDPNGVKPDPSKVEAIVNMREPEYKKDIQRLIGMLNYLNSQYIPDMSTITAPVRSLLKADVPFVWNTEHEPAFNKVKEILSTTPGLRLFDPNLKVQIQCDVSKTRLGACLLQEGPVAYYSKALTPTEMNWFPIEKEGLALVCAIEKCQHYIYGREVEVRSDHKPLEMITRESIHKVSPRILAMLLRLMKYNLYMNYQPSPTMYIADTLSRAYVETEHESDDIEVDTNMRIHSLVTNLPMSNQRNQKV